MVASGDGCVKHPSGTDAIHFAGRVGVTDPTGVGDMKRDQQQRDQSRICPSRSSTLFVQQACALLIYIRSFNSEFSLNS